jgi:hypothetical protein
VEELDPQPIGRFDWEKLIFRAELPRHLKTVCWALAIWGNKDGSNVKPGQALTGDGLELSERSVGVYTDELVGLGWLILVRRGGGTGREGRANVYQLSTPGALAPMRLDPDYNRYYPKRAGKKPSPKSDPKPTSGQHPVDNAVENPIAPESDPKPTSGKSADRPEVGYTPTRSGLPTDPKPTSDYQTIDQPKTNTTRVVPLGGDPTLRETQTAHNASNSNVPTKRAPPLQRTQPRRQQPKKGRKR